MANDRPVRAGVESITVDGTTVNAAGTIRYSLGGPAREDIEAATGPVGFKERRGTPFLEFDLVETADTSISELEALVDVTITCKLLSGKVLSFRNAWASGPFEPDVTEGTVAVRFAALGASEVLP